MVQLNIFASKDTKVLKFSAHLGLFISVIIILFQVNRINLSLRCNAQKLVSNLKKNWLVLTLSTQDFLFTTDALTLPHTSIQARLSCKNNDKTQDLTSFDVFHRQNFQRIDIQKAISSHGQISMDMTSHLQIGSKTLRSS